MFQWFNWILVDIAEYFFDSNSSIEEIYWGKTPSKEILVIEQTVFELDIAKWNKFEISFFIFVLNSKFIGKKIYFSRLKKKKKNRI